MSNTVRTAPEAETPVNPYSLLDAVNASSDTSHTGWLLFLGLMTYLTIRIHFLPLVVCLTAFLPLGIHLPSGASGAIDQGKPFQYTLETCLPQRGCIA